VPVRSSAPDTICILRLSALGDVCHTVPLLRALQDQLPRTRLSWVIDRSAFPLVRNLDGVEWIVHDKRAGLRGLRELRRELGGRRFDALLVTQRSARANLVAALIRADLRIGYDRARARDLHGLVVNTRIPAGAPDQHVMDCILSFLEPLGLKLPDQPRWDLPLSDDDRAWARSVVPDGERYAVLSPAASVPQRNWRAEYYARVADHAVRRHGLRMLLCGGPGVTERRLGDAIIAAMREPITDLIGRDTLTRFLALLARATLVISPDSGSAHMANAMGAPVLGLYAATDCRRSGPYRSRALCVNAFPEAARRYTGREALTLRWGRHIHEPGVMDLVDPSVAIERLDAFANDAAPMRR
jgi:heptosyltransferase I